jgi:hypothetical protein
MIRIQAASTCSADRRKSSASRGLRTLSAWKYSVPAARSTSTTSEPGIRVMVWPVAVRSRSERVRSCTPTTALRARGPTRIAMSITSKLALATCHTKVTAKSTNCNGLNRPDSCTGGR